MTGSGSEILITAFYIVPVKLGSISLPIKIGRGQINKVRRLIWINLILHLRFQFIHDHFFNDKQGVIQKLTEIM